MDYPTQRSIAFNKTPVNRNSYRDSSERAIPAYFLGEGSSLRHGRVCWELQVPGGRSRLSPREERSAAQRPLITVQHREHTHREYCSLREHTLLEDYTGVHQSHKKNISVHIPVPEIQSDWHTADMGNTAGLIHILHTLHNNGAGNHPAGGAVKCIRYGKIY